MKAKKTTARARIIKDALALALVSDSICSGASAYSSRIYRRNAHGKKRKKLDSPLRGATRTLVTKTTG